MQIAATSRIISAGIMLLAVPISAALGYLVASGSLLWTFVPLATIVLFVLFFRFPEFLWVIAVATMFLPGSIPILPLPFKPQELVIMLLGLIFVVDRVIFKKQGLKLGPYPDWVFLFLFLGVLLMHGISDRFGMRALGSSIWGGRGYFAIALAIAAYFIVQSMPPSERGFRKLPGLVLLVGFFDFGIKLLTSLVPQTAPYIYPFYADVSTGDVEGNLFASRWGFLANFGYLLILWSVSTCRISHLFERQKIWHALAILIGCALCLAGGYRSSVLVAAILITVATFRDFGLRGLFGAFPAILVIAVLMGIQSSGIGLPKTVQRAITFLPAPWDADVLQDANGSLEFRGQVWDLWWRSQFPRAPFFGRGFGMTQEQIFATLPYTTGIDPVTGLAAIATYTRNEAFVISGNIHHGFYSVIDRFGIVGLGFFLLWTGVGLWRAIRYFKLTKNQPLHPGLQWLAVYIFSMTVAFFPGALRVENFIPGQLLLLGVFYALSNPKEVREALREAENASRENRREHSSSVGHLAAIPMALRGPGRKFQRR